jgi:hypothetical protein
MEVLWPAELKGGSIGAIRVFELDLGRTESSLARSKIWIRTGEEIADG